MDESEKVSAFPRLIATLVSLVFLFCVYLVFDRYDWGYPLVKLACYSVLFAAVTGLYFLKKRINSSQTTVSIEIGILLFFLVGIFLVNFAPNARRVLVPPRSDIGFTTVHATKVLFVEGENPYSRTDINSEQQNLSPEYHGFHYGPMMIAGYLPSAFLGPYAFKLMSLVYVGFTAILLIFLAIRSESEMIENTSNALFVLVAYLMAGRFWHELFVEGVNDVFHTMLLLLGFLCFKYRQAFLAGLFTGLSISAKFAPGVFAVPFMPIRQRGFWIGLAVGLTPHLPFFIWDPAGLWRNAVWLRVIIPYNSTSLYSITPTGLQWIFAVVTAGSCIFAAWWAFRRERTFAEAVFGFTLLMLVTDAMQRQVHLNHLLWFLPFIALLFAENRHRIAATLGRRSVESELAR
jgi:hypothetical protein